MKGLVNYILYALLLMTVVSCNELDGLDTPSNNDGNKIILDFSTGTVASRAADTDMESAVSHLDIFIFNGDDEKLFHYERISVSSSRGIVNLEKTRDEFDSGDSYWIYVIANSSATFNPEVGTYTLNEFKAIEQTDLNVHLTGLSSTGGSVIPQNFLMSGIAYKFGTDNTETDFAIGYEPATPGTVLINDGTENGQTRLKVVLRRAAAKFVLTIKEGEKVSFSKDLDGSNAGYYFRNMPYETKVMSNHGTSFTSSLTTTPKVYRENYFQWSEDQITLTAYAYSHQWNVNELFEKGVSLIVDIPMTFEKSSTETTSHPINLYQVFLRPVDKDSNGNNTNTFTIARNTYYPVEITINAPGASEDVYVEPLEATYYAAEDWTEIDIPVSGMASPHYLQVNKDTLRIYNEEIDASSLEFSSSSTLKTISINQVTSTNDGTPYYVNKFGVPTYVGNSIYNAMSVSAPMDVLTGKITVKSPVPTNDAVRYFTITLTNQEGDTETVIVEQYPVIYITNTLGYYSYRSDFVGNNGTISHYENKVSPYRSRASWNNNNNWSYSYGYNMNVTFVSKVNTYTSISGNYRGKSTLESYSWRSDWGNVASNTPHTDVYRYYYPSGGSGSGNARMYHVHVTTTSGNYVVGRPALDEDGYTANTEANKVMVSPSFMIASQLGATLSNSMNLEGAKQHCAQYVETYRKVVYDINGNPVLDAAGNNTGEVVHLDNWRLPTKAEIDIILARQYGGGADAMDEVLAGQYYYSASGTVQNTYNQRTGGNGTYVRCVRDAF